MHINVLAQATGRAPYGRGTPTRGEDATWTVLPNHIGMALGGLPSIPPVHGDSSIWLLASIPWDTSHGPRHTYPWACLPTDWGNSMGMPPGGRVCPNSVGGLAVR